MFFHPLEDWTDEQGFNGLICKIIEHGTLIVYIQKAWNKENSSLFQFVVVILNPV